MLVAATLTACAHDGATSPETGGVEPAKAQSADGGGAVAYPHWQTCQLEANKSRMSMDIAVAADHQKILLKGENGTDVVEARVWANGAIILKKASLNPSLHVSNHGAAIAESAARLRKFWDMQFAGQPGTQWLQQKFAPGPSDAARALFRSRVVLSPLAVSVGPGMTAVRDLTVTPEVNSDFAPGRNAILLPRPNELVRFPVELAFAGDSAALRFSNTTWWQEPHFPKIATWQNSETGEAATLTCAKPEARSCATCATETMPWVPPTALLQTDDEVAYYLSFSYLIDTLQANPSASPDKIEGFLATSYQLFCSPFLAQTLRAGKGLDKRLAVQAFAQYMIRNRTQGEWQRKVAATLAAMRIPMMVSNTLNNRAAFAGCLKSVIPDITDGTVMAH